MGELDEGREELKHGRNEGRTAISQPSKPTLTISQSTAYILEVSIGASGMAQRESLLRRSGRSWTFGVSSSCSSFFVERETVGTGSRNLRALFFFFAAARCQKRKGLWALR